jgi:hypothetical protein
MRLGVLVMELSLSQFNGIEGSELCLSAKDTTDASKFGVRVGE